jgi:malate synthase
MPDYVNRASLSVFAPLCRFLEEEVLTPLQIGREYFWKGVAGLFGAFTPQNRALLAERDRLQADIDAWHLDKHGVGDAAQYAKFLRSIGYLADEPEPFRISTQNVDDEIARIAGPQLVVPVLNARFALNAANARWGSLYDALYGTDAIVGGPPGGGYDRARGDKVIAFAKTFLDSAIPLAQGKHSDVTTWKISGEILSPALKDPSAFVGYRGDVSSPAALLFKHNDLHIELVFDRTHRVGKDDPAGLADVVLESALTTIVDLEDSVAAVDGEDKCAAYANWLGLIRGDLTADFQKDGKRITRRLEDGRRWHSPAGAVFHLPGRSLLLVRNVGHLTTNPAMLLPDGSEAPEGILDTIVTAAIAALGLRGNGTGQAHSIYIVKPKMHGPQEAAFANRLFDAVEDLLGLSRHTIKIGLMDEERRTSANLSACIYALRNRIVFINTGFLDRTGDEIHTSMQAGAMRRKGAMRDSEWLKTYENRNVAIGLACGFAGKAQIGKGMWAAPDRMADMLSAKIAHPRSGANTAWVPSPTAATLHALHYHEVDVFSVQRSMMGAPVPPLANMLAIPLAEGTNWSSTEIEEELDNNAQGILGYVVRWIEQGVGCSKVPDIHDIGLMEDRATLRISSQHIANWLLHGVCTPKQVDDVLLRMAKKVDEQNAGDPHYRRMSDDPAGSLAFAAARALIFEGVLQPNGYTEPLLNSFRKRAKAQA